MSDPDQKQQQFVARPFKPRKGLFFLFLIAFMVWVGYLFSVYLNQVKSVN